MNNWKKPAVRGKTFIKVDLLKPETQKLRGTWRKLMIGLLVALIQKEEKWRILGLSEILVYKLCTKLD